MNDINIIKTLSNDLAKAQKAMDNAWHCLEKMEQSDSYHDGFRLVFGRHAKSARTRFEKRQDERDRIAKRLEIAKARTLQA